MDKEGDHGEVEDEEEEHGATHDAGQIRRPFLLLYVLSLVSRIGGRLISRD